MSFPPNLLPESEVPDPSQVTSDFSPTAPLEPVLRSLPDVFPRWSGWDVHALMVFTYLLVNAIGLIGIFAVRRLPAYRHLSLTDLANSPKLLIGAQTVAYLALLWFMYLVVRSRTHEEFSTAIRWNWHSVSLTGYLFGGILLAFTTEGLSRFLPIPKSLPIDKYFAGPGDAYVMAAFGITLAPLVEELIFRGMLYPVLRRYWQRFHWLQTGFRAVTIAVLLTALEFACIHGTQLGYAWGPILSIFFVGVVLTLARIRSNSVAASFLMHVGYNFTLFALLWIASDHFRHMERVGG